MHMRKPIAMDPPRLLPAIGEGNLAAGDIDLMLEALRQALSRPRGTLSAPDEASAISRAVEQRVGHPISADGLGLPAALDVFGSLLAQQGVPTDHPGYLAYIGSAPTPAAALMDGLLSTTGMIGSGWLGGAGLIWAENQALRWLADLAQLPGEAGGCFVSGGTAGNFSALAAARQRYRERTGRRDGLVLAGLAAHASIDVSAGLLDLERVGVACDEQGRMTAAGLAQTLGELAADGRLEQVVAIIAVAGSTNAGQIDDLPGVGAIARRHGIWFHVDAAYGGAFLCVPQVRPQFQGIELADSLIIDPHKGLFVPYDCCALLYAQPQQAMSAFTQEASYLDQINESQQFNPMHYAFHLSRRARGVPLWFSLVVHGSDAYRHTLERILALTDNLRQRIARHPRLELIEASGLSVILFKRRGWQAAEYDTWAQDCLRQGIALVVSTCWQGETVMRLCIMNTGLDEARCDRLLAGL
ncbi:pyridoxal phosphate-dependent decarboxylase family protein [Pseudomonas entomophila]|uniref:pyridoxal phosphate-dependent decarboxylase family protein n=1 Tax=Pseudomonas entomophila TaxID=312306 RepID=UPI001F000C9D|nr:pyridoxal-dependent decarboxylase [Pseudomonas entomophila]MCG8296018.1 pyridoxal-dependent decarboxylase [Pseudomonas entomophila]